MVAHLGAESLFTGRCTPGQATPAMDKECSNIIVASQRLEELLETLDEMQASMCSGEGP